MAVGRGGNASGVRDGDDGARGLGVGDNLPVGRVRSGVILVLALACLEDAVSCVAGAVEVDADAVEDVLAEVVVIGATGVAELHAEAVATDEVVPFNGLDWGAGKIIREHDASHGVSAEISTVGVHLTSPVVLEDVDLGLVDETDDLNIVGGLHELDTGQGTRGDQTGTMARLRAVGDHDTLDITDLTAHVRGTPKAEVVKAIQPRSLAERVLVLRG